MPEGQLKVRVGLLRATETDVGFQVLFQKDFLTVKPNLQQYVMRLQEWRDRYESILDRKTRTMYLETCSHWLIEFQYRRFDEIEVFGQYLKVAYCFPDSKLC